MRIHLYSIPALLIFAGTFLTVDVTQAAVPAGPFGEKSLLLKSETPVTSEKAAPIQFGCADLRRTALRMSTHASNLMNRETTRTPSGGPYKRLEVVCRAAGGAFCNVESMDEARLELKPGHPDADAKGYVKMPAINLGAESAGLNTAASELKLLATRGTCGTKTIQDGLMTVVRYDSGFDVMMDTMTFTADGRIARWSRTTRDGRTQNFTFKDDGSPVGL